MIRLAGEDDVGAILSVYAPYILSSTATFEYDVPSPPDFLARFRDITRQFPWLVWEEQGEILGYAYAAAPFTRPAYAWCAEPSVYLKPGAQGRGAGGALYDALEKCLSLQGYQVLYALITGENERSLRFHEGMGYRVRMTLPDCGFKFDRWLSLVWMEKRIKTVEIPKAFPTPFPGIVRDAQRFSDILDSLSLS